MRSKVEDRLEEEEKSEEAVKSEEEKKFVEEDRFRLQRRLDKVLEQISTDKESLGREIRRDFMEWTWTLDEREELKAEVEKQLRIERI